VPRCDTHVAWRFILLDLCSKLEDGLFSSTARTAPVRLGRCLKLDLNRTLL
jgi:hypothetical protein